MSIAVAIWVSLCAIGGFTRAFQFAGKPGATWAGLGAVLHSVAAGLAWVVAL